MLDAPPRKFVTSLILIGLLVLSWSSDSGAKKNPSDSSDKVGVIVVLGYGHFKEALPSSKMVQRVLGAIELYRQKRAKHIMLCGGYTSGNIAEAEEMKIMALAHGIPARAILLENGSMTTGQNKANAEYFINRHHFRSAALVSHETHLKRAVKQFEKIKRLRSVVLFPVDDIEIPAVNLVYDEELPSSKNFDAVVIHGKSKPIDFLSDSIQVDSYQRSLAKTAADLYQKGFDDIPFFFWHPATSVGHITRAQIIGIAAIGFGLPAKRVIYDEGRRYSPAKRELFDDCKAHGWTRILAVLPRVRKDDVEWVKEKYEEAGLEVTVILTGRSK